MEQAGRFLAGLERLRDACDAGDIACTAWKRVVGKRIAVHARAAKLVRDKLVIEVEDWVWHNNLRGMSQQILRRLAESIGAGIVKELEFRVIPQRMGPKVAEASMQLFELRDEAEDIADPGLRRIYRRKRDQEIA